MKCFECPARREVTDGLTNPTCKAGVYPQTLKSTFRVGCRYGSKQIDAWLKRKAPPTHKDVLLKTWAHDTEAMQCAFVHKDMSGGYWYMTKNKHGMFCWMWTLDHSEAMKKQVEFLNSAAEVGK